MIAETVVAGITTIFVSSLMFSSVQIKRQRRWDEEDEQRELREIKKKELKENNIKPFLYIRVDTECPMCGRNAKQNGGLRQPKTCHPGYNCKVSISHLHVECTFCENKWLMQPSDSKNF